MYVSHRLKATVTVKLSKNSIKNYEVNSYDIRPWVERQGGKT